MLVSKRPRCAPSHVGRRFISVLAGTVPEYRNGHLVLHAPIPSASWPKQVESLPLVQSVWEAVKPLDIGVSLSASPKNQIGSTTATLYTQIGSRSLPFDLTESPESLSQLAAFCSNPPPVEPPKKKALDIFVCTHGTRDCRCGTVGAEVYRRIQQDASQWSSVADIRVAEISHIGKHVFAANVLSYPSNGPGDWYGALTPADVPRLFRALLFPSPKAPVWLEKWRGRLGLSIPEQQEFYARHAKGHVSMDKSNPYRQTTLGDQVHFEFQQYDGTVVGVSGFIGETLKDAAKRLDLVEAICGGIQECATCACDITTDDPLPEMSAEEDEQLDFAISRKENTRLACCIPITPNTPSWTLKLPRA